MAPGYLLNRVLLTFRDEVVHSDLSAVVHVDGYLWLGSDEVNSLERLSPLNQWAFGNHQSFQFKDIFDGFNDDDGEIDIEGIAHEGDCLWVIGSHSTKRKKIKKDQVERLNTVKFESNRYWVARIPIDQGTPCKVKGDRTAAYLERNDDGNVLMTALKQDPQFAPFLADTSSECPALPGKDNGLDIEGLAIRDGRLLLGMRGPVLRGVAVILEIEPDETNDGVMSLKPLGKNGELFKKHFLDLEGFGIRDLRVWGDDLLILAGPTMDLDGTISLYCLKDAFDLSNNSYSKQGEGQLEMLFDIPHGRNTDRAEGMALFSSLGQDTLLIVYDSPAVDRCLGDQNVLADVFTLK